MKKLFLLVLFSFLLTFLNHSNAQKENFSTGFQKFLKYYNGGDFLKAEKSLVYTLESSDSLTANHLIVLYNNLGVVCIALGKFDKALEYNYKAESFTRKEDQNGQNIADIFNNRGYIFYNIEKVKDRINLSP